MAKYDKYAEYKDSGVEWLGEIPSDWIVSKFGYVKTVLTDYTANGSFADLKSNVIYLDEPSFARLVRLTDLRKNLDNDNGVWIDQKSYEYLKKSALFGGEFLLANVGAYAGLFYQMPMNKGHASLAPNMFMAKFEISKVLPRFMAYVGQADNIAKQLQLSATASSAQPKLNKDDFKKVIFAYPSLATQTQIAKFLDHETAKIDSLIEKQQQLIQLLQEKRQAMVSHAVTKGLNPNVPMKDSDVEWLGQVPEHWIISGFKKYLESIVDYRGKTPEKVDEGVFLVTARNIKNGQIDYALSQEFVAKKDYEQIMSRGKPILKDVLFTTEAPLGEVAQIDNVDIALAQRIIKFRGKENVLDNTYLKYFIISQQFQDSLMTFATGSTALGIKAERLGYLKIAIPPLIEQYKIVEYIEIYLLKNKSLIQKAQSAIQLMQERRTALISAAVTGKIDVRNWQNPTEAKMEFSA